MSIAPAAVAVKPPKIELSGLSMRFRQHAVLREINLAVPEGQTLCVIGESGCGKTVLLKLMIGLLRPTAGTVRFGGRDLAALTEADLSRLRIRFGFLFQMAALFDSLTIYDNVAFGPREHGTFDEQTLAKVVAERLQEVGLPAGLERKKPAELSGGQRKRVGLARALALDPEVMLYDEPTTGLDPINTARVNHLIIGLQQKLSITSVVVTHDMKSAFAISDRLAMVHGGVIISQGEVEKFRSADDPRVADFIEGRAPVKESVEALLNG